MAATSLASLFKSARLMRMTPEDRRQWVLNLAKVRTPIVEVMELNTRDKYGRIQVRPKGMHVRRTKEVWYSCMDGCGYATSSVERIQQHWETHLVPRYWERDGRTHENGNSGQSNTDVDSTQNFDENENNVRGDHVNNHEEDTQTTDEQSPQSHDDDDIEIVEVVRTPSPPRRQPRRTTQSLPPTWLHTLSPDGETSYTEHLRLRFGSGSPGQRKSARLNSCPSVCSICHRVFQGQSRLNVHLVAAHYGFGAPESAGGLDFCVYCGEEFDSKRLATHVARAHNNGFYDCRRCSESFKTKREMEAHMKKNHGGSGSGRDRIPKPQQRGRSQSLRHGRW